MRTMGGASTIKSGPIAVLLQRNEGLCHLIKSLAKLLAMQSKCLGRHHACSLKVKVLTPCWAEHKGRKWEGTERWENTKGSTDTVGVQLHHANIPSQKTNVLIFQKVHKMFTKSTSY